jgi:amino acid transporter
MIIVFPVIFIFWKFYKKTKWLKPEDVDLYQDLEEIEEYHRNYKEIPPK